MIQPDNAHTAIPKATNTPDFAGTVLRLDEGSMDSTTTTSRYAFGEILVGQICQLLVGALCGSAVPGPTLAGPRTVNQPFGIPIVVCRAWSLSQVPSL